MKPKKTKKPQWTAAAVHALTVSHVTYGQCARIVGVGNQAVRHRVTAGMDTVELAGVKMISIYDVAAWIRERAERE